MMISYFPSSSTLTFCLYVPYFLSLLLIIHYLSLSFVFVYYYHYISTMCQGIDIYFKIGHRVVVVGLIIISYAYILI